MKIATYKYDLVQIRKDPMLMLSVAVPVLLWAVMHFGFPAVQRLLMDQAGIDISPYYQEAGLFLLAVLPMMFGMVYGFILLDERDGGIIMAISVTPLGRRGYFKLRMGLPVIFSFFAAILFCRLLELGSQLNWIQLILLTIVLTMNAPILLLFLGAFAGNKVEGMALVKGFGVLMSAMLINFIAPPPWNWLGGFSPLFWFERAFTATSQTDFLIYAFAAIISHSALFLLLYRRFLRKMD